MEKIETETHWLNNEESRGLSIQITSKNGSVINLKVGDAIPTKRNEHGVLEYDENNKITIDKFAINENGKITHILVRGIESTNGTTIFTYDKFLEFLPNKLPIDENWHGVFKEGEIQGAEDHDEIIVV